MRVTGFDSLMKNSETNKTRKDDFSNDFKETFMNALYSASDLEKKQEQLGVDFINGDLESLHDLTIATQKADIAIQTVVEVRNKVIDAYKEIMRMQI